MMYSFHIQYTITAGLKDSLHISELVAARAGSSSSMATRALGLFISIPYEMTLDHTHTHTQNGEDTHTHTPSSSSSSLPATHTILHIKLDSSVSICTLTLDKNTSIREIRDRAGQELLQLPNGWTEVEDDKDKLKVMCMDVPRFDAQSKLCVWCSMVYGLWYRVYGVRR
ncbi:hypothetical protein EON63_22185 [archaeon]|nr:MAG: hypothetical protein EON63_22185 [archaeon]